MSKINIDNNAKISFPIFSILGIAFVILKLCNIITWSWWWVLLPFYGPIILGILIVTICFLLFCTVGGEK